MPSPPLKWISIQGYRAARELEFEPGPLMALFGEASSGTSTVLTAIWTLLEAAAPPTTIEDISHGTAWAEGPESDKAVARPGHNASRPGSRHSGRIHLEAELERGAIFLDATPPDTLNLNRAGAPPVLFLPANLRSRTMVAPATGVGAADVAELLRPPLADHHWAAADGGIALVRGMERLLVLEPAQIRAADRGAGALSQPAHAAAPPPGAVHPRRARQPDPVLDARTCLPDFEAVAGLDARGRSRKPRKAYRRFHGNGDVPPVLRQAVEKVLREARA